MSDLVVPRIPKWPFLMGDLILLGVAGLVLWQGSLPMGLGEMLIIAGCVALGAILGVSPFVLEYRYLSKLVQVERLQQSLLQVHKIETVGRQIASATASWQAVQDDATKAVEAARQINDSMTAEAHAFQSFLEKANDSERQHLRFEVEKLRRAEGDWLRVLMRILDHVYALVQAAFRSGQPGLIEQLSSFQRACRDAALRVGLVAVEANQGEAYDAQVHQWDQDDVEPPAEMVVVETLATGFRFQGQTLRRALVALEPMRAEPSPLSVSQINQHHAENDAAEPLSPPPAVEPAPAAEPVPAEEQMEQNAEGAEPEPWPGFSSREVTDGESR
jgi:molecular chaperone GrpE (heat shock protein)